MLVALVFLLSKLWQVSICVVTTSITHYQHMCCNDVYQHTHIYNRQRQDHVPGALHAQCAAPARPADGGHQYAVRIYTHMGIY